LNHEKTNLKRLKKVKNELISKGYIKNPIIVDKTYKIILDGHHRVAALKEIGAKMIPVYFVDYKSKKIKVFLRRKYLLSKILKEVVINYCLTGKIFPSKTTRHFIKNKPKNFKIYLNSLF
jgi:hypothetical protein